jgi:hypothetical protein
MKSWKNGAKKLLIIQNWIFFSSTAWLPKRPILGRNRNLKGSPCLLSIYSLCLPHCDGHFCDVKCLKANKKERVGNTDKRTDVWSRDFIIWKINFGLWAVAWAGLWNKRVWADYEQLFWVFFSISHGQKKRILIFFFLHCSVRTEKLHKIRFKFFQKKIFWTPKTWKNLPQIGLLIPQ